MSYPTTIFCVVPVHSRVNITRHFLDQLQRQGYETLRVIVVDDGSIDDTGEMLKNYKGLQLQTVLGSGSLWWGGAMRLGMQVARQQMADCDALLMLNDDVEIANNFLARIADRARDLGPKIVIGTGQRDLDTGQKPFFGYEIDYRRCRLKMVTDLPDRNALIEVDALCGRGTMISCEVLSRIGYIDCKRFPHFWGDIEYTARAKDFGFRLVCDPQIWVGTSFEASDRKRVGRSWWQRYVSPVSSKNVRQLYSFWAIRGPKALARTVIFRLPLLKLWSLLIGTARER
jgi:GT2 family glycosyltransferase